MAHLSLFLDKLASDSHNKNTDRCSLWNHPRNRPFQRYIKSSLFTV
uniref:Uncharacterized protein n=1 Tax=Anguilla anguilla TaxID=7936 RepID=A0A0E9SVJ5_ANGAN